MTFTNGASLKWLPVEDLVLDRSNPRIARLLEMFDGEVTEERMQLALGAEVEQTNGETTYHSLRVSIQTNRGIIHPVIVNDCADGQVVIEGNTRTLIYKEFKKKGVDGDWETIPCLVHQDLMQPEIDAIRLQAHLVGPRQWDPYSKAKYLYFLRNSQHLTWEQVIDFCGGQANQAKVYVAAYEDMEEHYRSVIDSDDQFDVTRFSAFAELQAPRVKQALLENGYDEKDFARWVRDKLVFPLNTVRRLPAILGDESAKETFLRDGARAAMRELERTPQDELIQGATLHQLASEISRRILQMSYAELNRLRRDIVSAEVAALTDARDNLDELCTDLAGE